MKNYIIKICLILFATFFASSCNDDFLERYPLDEISNESFWNTENDLLVYNNSFYDLARNDDNVPIMMGHDDAFDSHRLGIWHLSGFSDDTAPRHSRHNDYQKLRAGKHTVPSGTFVYGYKGWNFLRAINVGMDNYGKANVSDEVRNKYVGEARLFRAWFYHDKVSKFGDVQWVDTELNIDDDEILYGERDDREVVMAKVLEDLNFATTNMPNDWGDGGAPGRLNRWAALLVKSRICLFEGTWRKYHGGNEANMWLEEAAKAAKELMDDGPYSLYITGDPTTDYNAIHRMTDLSGNPEVLYWRRYELGIYTNHVQSYHRQYNGGATKSLVEDYLCTDGQPITLSTLYQGDEEYEKIFENRDPRLRQTVLHPADQAIYKYGNHDFGAYTYPRIQGMPGGSSTYTGYHIIKVYEVNAAYATYNTSSTPAITLRFGEALLNYAEAKAELGSITQGDLDISINLLRKRVDMPNMMLNPPMDPRYANDGVSSLIVEIRRERRIELFMEGFRYDDLRRWKQGKKLEIKDYGMRWDEATRNKIDPEGTATVQTSIVDGVEYLDIYKGTDYETPEFDESKHYLWPIPISATSQNPNLGQNPGWGSN
ncbi:RagB/SusD family nutrient uptake outer membrane protein [Flammeovirgaceae bacterium SG7u.111]|nr:RagB/SusD family nutrient uptake outer membrane protein [Flammeovirgaceae bacterium SG7u.132]WPO37687.1 RagB/SusD family nutrient uptake outer membrane protein [Flammeovirgaceae bacterium SG7u.111]